VTLDKDAIMACDDKQVISVEVPEWAGTVHLRTMTAADRDAFETAVAGGANGRSLENIRARLLVKVLCNPEGERIFADDEAADLGTRNGIILDRLFDAARTLNRIGEDAIEEAVGN
tara:strand:- start:553 stop:900 length:348 start_codon:yes stop_codon:yes gene_type:complete